MVSIDTGISTTMSEVQLLLAEKRTTLALMRTGIAVLALPLSVLGLLVVTSKYYNPLDVFHFLIPLAILLFFLVILGGYLIFRSMSRMHHYDELLKKIKSENFTVAEFID